ncbi:hypothetical protein ACC720_38930, partial [Rhizobium ruizarguesonis]
AGLLALPRFASAAAGTIDLYSGADANIVDLWNNTIRPAFEKVGLRIGLRLQSGERTVGDGAQNIIVAGIGDLQRDAGMR